MPEALAQVKRELGPDAVILGTRSGVSDGLQRLLGRNRVEITAAPAGMTTPAPRVAPRATLPAHLMSYYTTLIQNEVAEELALKLMKQAATAVKADASKRPSAMREVVREFIARMIPTVGGIQLPAGRMRKVALVGPAGSGKTTTLAKLAAHFKLRRGKRVTVLSLDTHRLAADEQLQRYADIIGVSMHVARSRETLNHALAALDHQDLLLVDTPGAGPRDGKRIEQIRILLDAVRPDETHLVLPACTAPASQAKIAAAFAPLGVCRVVLTRLDEAVGLGVILNAMNRLDWRLSYLTDGQKVPNDIEEACGRRVASLLLDERVV